MLDNLENTENKDQNIENENLDQNQNIENENLDEDIDNEEDYDLVELNEEVAYQFLRENRKLEFESIDDFLKPKEVIKEVNPYEDLLDDDDKAFFNFKKETGRSRKEFEALNSNLDELPKIVLARERVRLETGLKDLSDDQIDEHIAETLGIDLDEMGTSDKIKLAAYTKEILKLKKEEQEKYRKPIEAKQPEVKTENPNKEEYVELTNGAFMKKSEYVKLENNRQQAILKAKESVNSVTASNFKIVLDDKGTEKELNFEYKYSDEDKHSMLSIVSDIDTVVKNRYGSDEGFNHKQFAEDMQWSDPTFREKAIGVLLEKAIAENTENLLKERGNVKFNYDPLQRTEKEGIKIVSMSDAIKGIH